MNKELEQVLALCLDEIRQGESLENCLARYPHLARELEPLLRTAVAVQHTTHVAMRPEFKAAARGRILASLRPTPSQAHRPRRAIGWRWGWAAGLAAFLTVLLGWGAAALANNSLPDETLYPVKIATEEVKLALTPGKIRKAHLEAALMEERAREISELARLNRPAQIERVSQRLDWQLARLATIAAAQDMTPDQSQAELETLLEEQASRQQAALEKALSKAPESARPALRRALERSEAKYEEARHIIEERKAQPAKPDWKRPNGKAIPPGRLTPPTAPPIPTPKGFVKTADGLASVECPSCLPKELQQYLEQAHRQALSEGKPFNAVVNDAYTFVDNKLVKQKAQKLFRIAESGDELIRIEWECGGCAAATLDSLLVRAENTFSSAVAATSPSKKPALYFAVSPDATRFNVTPLASKGHLVAKRPTMIASYPWPLENSTELTYRTTLAFGSAMRYAREDFIAEWLATWMSKGISSEQYAARLQELKSGQAYSANPDSFSKTRLGTDIGVALRDDGFTNEKLTLLIQRMEGKGVTWMQFKQIAGQLAGKDLPALSYLDKGVELWRSWKASNR